ncbi:Cupredoxin [Rhodotorula diobovata]|uniref:Cupredoxin n=1 Tax=Rhodotorula diobovata TaxID=5288 RepID=A0A5C5FUK6_9BASI|nr:Cupredoxin [Rhodotorula diobovata]
MKPDEQDEDADETPCCVKGTFCETMYPDWVVCGSNETAPRISSSAIDTVPLHPTPTSTTSSREAIMAISGSKGKDKGGKHGKPSHHDDDDDMRWGSGGGWGWDRPHKPNWPHKPRPPPSRPSVINKPNELRLSPKWNINARPQRREYWFTIDERMGSPDGFERPMLVVNGQFPGPLIEANNGDTIVVHVTNALDQPITLHWHGLVQKDTIWEDGPSGVTQCPIGVGKSYTYSFPVNGDLEFGTYWWHAHRRALYADGITGPLIVHSPKDPLKRGRDYDIDQIVMLHDWYHNTSDYLVNSLLSPQGLNGTFLAPSPNSQLLNGVGLYNCSLAPPGSECNQRSQLDLPELVFPPDQRVRLRFIHAGAHPVILTSVDEHSLKVIEADDTGVFGPSFHRVALNVAQRYSAVLDTSMDSHGDSYYLRADVNTGCLGAPFPDLDPQARMIIRIVDDRKRPPRRTLPSSRDWSDRSSGNCTDLDESLLRPRIVRNVPARAAQISFFNSSLSGGIVATGNASNIFEWRLNNITFENFAYNPILHQVVRGDNFNNGRFAVVTANKVEAVDLVIQNVAGPDHPMHLHSSPFAVLARGEGQLSPSAAAKLRVDTTNPLRRDTVGVPPGTWVMVRVMSSVPGVFAFHCHIVWHQSQGLMGAFISQPDKLRRLKIPADNLALCDGGDPNLIDPGRRVRRNSLPQFEASTAAPLVL